VSCFVFKGVDERDNSPVALKIVNWNNVFDREAAFQQMRMEASALARVKHPRVVQFIDFGIDARWPYLVTEFISGSALGELLRDGGALPLNWCVHVLSQMVEGLGAVWRAGLVHRDIKPDNVLVDAEGNAKLIDFGLAKSPALQAAAGQTGPEVAGTPSYLAPEQAKDASLADQRSDIYSLGVTFYEMLTGKLPFEGKNKMQMIFHHINTPPVPPREIEPSVPELISELCVWMLHKNMNMRPQNYEELRSAIDAMI
jgi:serine/threonine-protein kinase